MPAPPTTCAGCGRPAGRDDRFCAGCGAALPDGAQRDRRGLATVVFCDVVESTALGERLDPETLRDVMRRYFAAVAGALRAHGGEVEKFIGDAVMCVFGLARAREDDALRACRAALDALAAIERLNAELEATHTLRLAVRVGVESGEVVVGDPHGGPALVTGAAVTTAARLHRQAAGPVSLDATLRPGAAVADYVLDERLSGAGASQVYRARQPALGRHVTLHLVPARGDADAEAFLARARTLARIDHPHVLPVYDVGAWNGAAFVVSGVPPGQPVPDAVALTPLTPAAAVSVVDQLAGALETLEAAGLGIAPEPADVFLHGSAAEPLAVLAPLTVAPSSASASDSLVALLETLAPQGSGVVVSARRAHAERPSAVAAAARAALPRPRRRRRALIAVAAAAAVLVAAAIVVARSGNRSAAPAARASDVPGRIVARIPVGAGAQSVARRSSARPTSTAARD